jgi:hypothetical protein
VLNEIFFLESLIFFSLCFFSNVVNIISLWYLAGIYLFGLGFLLLLDDGDIFIGFLWVIDLGVGLIFFIFILHFSNFLQQKAIFDLSNKFFFLSLFFLIFLMVFFYFLNNPVDSNFNYELRKTWFFHLSWYDYYELFNFFSVTDLNVMRELYFINNSFGFFVINFMLFYGIFGAINLCFLIKKIFAFLTIGQLFNFNILNEINSTFFIRNQNFIRQQSVSAGSRVWLKNKKNKI